MEDRPTAAELLQAIGDLLADEVLPVVDATVQHKVRVAANLCRILERELQLGGDAAKRERSAFAALLGHDGTLVELNGELAALLRVGDASFLAEALPIVVDATVGKLAVDKPGYALGADR